MSQKAREKKWKKQGDNSRSHVDPVDHRVSKEEGKKSVMDDECQRTKRHGRKETQISSFIELFKQKEHLKAQKLL